MEIKILGSGCTNCVNLARVTKEAADELGIVATFEKVEDYQTILQYGVMSTPALVINGAVVVSGRVPSRNQVKAMLLKAE